NEFIVQDTVEAQFLSAGVNAIELDLCNFNAQVRRPQMANGFPDPCAEPSGGGRSGVTTTPSGGKGMTVTSVTSGVTSRVTSGGQALTFQHANDRLHIN